MLDKEERRVQGGSCLLRRTVLERGMSIVMDRERGSLFLRCRLGILDVGCSSAGRCVGLHR